MDRIGNLAAHADDVDDRAVAAGGHPLDHQVGRVNVAEELGVHGVTPGLCGQVRRGMALGGAGRVDQDIDRTESRFDIRDHPRRLVGIAQVGDDCERGIRDALQPGHRRIQIFLAARDQRDFGAAARKGFGTGEADPFRCAGDDDDLACKWVIHAVALLDGTMLSIADDSCAR